MGPDNNWCMYCGREDQIKHSCKESEMLSSLIADLDQAIAAHDNLDPRHPSHGGQHTNGRCCPFGNVLPGTLSEFKRIVNQYQELKKSCK